MLVGRARKVSQKKLAALALAGVLSAGALTVAGEAAEAQAQNGGGEVVNREVQVNEDRDYTGLWGLLGLLGLAGLAGLRRKREDDNVDVRRAPSAERGSTVRNGSVRDSEVVSSTEGRGGVDGDRVNVNRGDAEDGVDARRTPSKRKQ